MVTRIRFNEEAFLIKYASSSTNFCLTRFLMFPAVMARCQWKESGLTWRWGLASLSVAWLLCINFTDRLSNSH